MAIIPLKRESRVRIPEAASTRCHQTIPPNRYGAIAGYAVILIEGYILHRVIQIFQFGLLGDLTAVILVTASFISWFYAMHLFGLYENDTSTGEL